MIHSMSESLHKSSRRSHKRPWYRRIQRSWEAIPPYKKQRLNKILIALFVCLASILSAMVIVNLF